MKNILLVPTQTDALFLSKDTLVTEASADFSHLPYFNGKRDVNADVANISESIVSQPLQDQNLRLGKGLHLHWALPDAMNRGKHREDGRTDFPIVPNRWLVTRKMGGEEKSWVVESDYLFPEDKVLAADDPLRKSRRDSITVPVEISGRESGGQPFRYMGRKMESGKYTAEDTASERYPKLTTVGYGEPSFAAFYPNCHSVFGFHDAEISKDSGAVTYDIVGWYSDKEQDFFEKLTSGVVISKRAFDNNLTQFSEAEVEGYWQGLLKFNMLTDRTGEDSIDEQARIVLAPSAWELPDEFAWDNGFLAAFKVLQNTTDQYLQERASWQLRPVVTQSDLDDLISPVSDVTVENLLQSGWLETVPSQNERFIVVPDADRPTVEPDFLKDPDLRFQAEKTMLALRLKCTPEQVLVFSKIKVDTSGQAGHLPQGKVGDVSVVIGNTGTEALSNYLSERLSNPVMVSFAAYAKLIPDSMPAKREAINGQIVDIPAMSDLRATSWKALEEAGWLKPVEGSDDKLLTANRGPLPGNLNFYRKNFQDALAVFQLSFASLGEEANAKKLEEQLEALYLLDKLDHRVLDLDAKFDEARHENGFNAVAGGHHWTITVNSRKNSSANVQQTTERPPLPAPLTSLLNDINTLQWTYDRARLQLESLGTQLYADWYKYMVSTYPPEDTRIDYPDIDEVRYFIETKVMADIQKLEDETGHLILAKPEDIAKGENPTKATGGFGTATAKQLSRKLNELFRKLNEVNHKNEQERPDSDAFMLQRTGGPRYYEPKEPVVLLANSDTVNPILQPTKRHGQDGRQRKDGLLSCHVVAVENQHQKYLRTLDVLKNTLPEINRLLNPDAGEQVGYTEWLGQPWNPFRLDWEVELAPLAEGANLEEKDYAADLIEQNFDLKINDPDLEAKTEKIAQYKGRNPNIYTGKSLLTPQAKRNLHERLEAYLTEKLAEPFSSYLDEHPEKLIAIFQVEIKVNITERNRAIWDEEGNLIFDGDEGESMQILLLSTSADFPTADEQTNKFVREFIREKILGPFSSDFPDHAAGNTSTLAPVWLEFYEKWLEEKGEMNANNPVATALLAYTHLRNENLHLLSQAFSGFNDAMLQLRQSYQLPITDPIGFKDYLPFTEQVAQLAELSTHLAPQPLTDFNPIRTGEMVINQLRLIDTFGQKRDIDLGKLDRVLGGEKVTEKKDSFIKVPLQPRLAQPARLNFRWLSAQAGTEEMNVLNSPICGWILTNQLDDSLVIYDPDGRMLGSIEAEPDSSDDTLARWNIAPGDLHPVLPEAIENEFLQKMVAKIRGDGADYVRQFIDGLDSVLRSIEPEEFESQQALSLLVGRPVALVRATLSLELQGAPAVDQGWHAFYQDRIDGDFDRNRDQFTAVEFPVRLGKSNQFNDGLVGFWNEEANGKNPGTSLSDDFFLNLKIDGQTTTHDHIHLLHKETVPIRQSIAAKPHLVSMLIDPRAKVHVTTGILPVKEINIPPNQYLPAMQQMAVTFLTAPLLSPAANVQTLLPTVDGYEWSWIEAKSKGKTPTHTIIEKADFQEALVDGILAYLMVRNWITPDGESSFRFRSDNEPLEGQFQQLDTDLFGIIEEISTEKQMEDGSTVLSFSRTKFTKKITQKREPVGKTWNLMVRSDVTWCRFVPGQPDRFEVLPLSARSSAELPGLGFGELVDSILTEYQKEVEIPNTLDPLSTAAQLNTWREVFTEPTIERQVFQGALTAGILAYLEEYGWVAPLGGGSYQFFAEGPPLDGQFQQVEEDLFGILDFISTSQNFADGNTIFSFSGKNFRQRISAGNEPAGRAWQMLLNVGWCKLVEDRPDTFKIVPLAKRKIPELAGLGMEFLVEEILQKHQQILTEPTTAAQFTETQMTIREGYLKLEKI